MCVKMNFHSLRHLGWRRFNLFLQLVCFGFAGLSLSAVDSLAAPPSLILDIRIPTHEVDGAFPEGRPPQQVKIDPKIEAGLCVSDWSCSVSVKTLRTKFGLKMLKAEIAEINVITKLSIKIWLVENATTAVVSHEKTHRAISEHYYARTEIILRKIAAGLGDRQFTIPVKNADAILKERAEQIGTIFRDEFMWQTQKRSEFAQARFDAITDHGRNSIKNPMAMSRAIAEEETHWEMIGGKITGS
jgi:hypothetical protein